ncbi:MAG: DUF5654 family protein [Patescibacteria group bacterium]|nr:DUF5654 family protein [Patescibacteria group bacterium]
MPKLETPQSAKELPKVVIKQISALSASAFGLIAALAWNNVIKEAVDTYIKPFIGPSSGLVSLLIYAVIITVLAVLVTLQLSRLEEKLEQHNI